MSTNSASKRLKELVLRAKKKAKSKYTDRKETDNDGYVVVSIPVPIPPQATGSKTKQGSKQNLAASSSKTKQGSKQNLTASDSKTKQGSRQNLVSGFNLTVSDDTEKGSSNVKGGSKSQLLTKKPSVRKSRSKISKRSDQSKQKKNRFSEEPGVDDQVSRSPSRLGYREDVPLIVEPGTWENTSQDSPRDDYQLLDLKGISLDSPNPHIETKESGQQTDFPATPSSPQVATTDRQDQQKPKRQFVTSHKFLTDTPGSSPKHPFEKTVFVVKTPRDNQLAKTNTHYNHRVTNSHLHGRPLSSHSVSKSETTRPHSTRIDSGYASRQETLRLTDSPHKPLSANSSKSVSYKTTADILCLSPDGTSNIVSKSIDVEPKISTAPANMSYYIRDNFSPMSSARKQEKEELQQLNERFGNYVQKVRILSEQSNRMDSNAFVKQMRILEEEMANLKTMYERELDALRQEVNATHKESHNYQVQCEKNKQAAIDFETRLSVETDKSRRLMDDINGLQQKVSGLEAEVLGMRQLGDGRVDFQNMQREMDKVLRESEDHKHRQEQNALLRAEAEDRCHTLTKKLEFNEQVHAQQLAECRERIEQSQATIISLESRVREASKMETAMPDVLKQVRDQAEMELKRFRLESEENYNRNISALKCQMDNDAGTIERLSNDKSILQGQIGELTAKIRSLEGQIITLDHQRNTAEEMIQQERSRSAVQIQEMERKVRDMHELVFSKMREAGTARDLHLPLKAEIEAMKVLLQEEERRLQSPLATSSHHVQTTYTPPIPLSLPSVSSGPVPATTVSQQYAYQPAPTQHITSLESPFITQSAAHNQYGTTQSAALGQYSTTQSAAFGQYTTAQSAGHTQYTAEQVQEQQEPLFTHVSLPSEQTTGTEFIGATKYTYETTPSVNRLQIDNPPRNSPRLVGPISRAKSAPVQRGQNISLVPTNLGQGKDYFDEMFRDLTRETLYTQTRPKSSPLERPPSGPRDKPQSGTGNRSPSTMQDRPASRERPASAARERPPSRERPSSQAEILKEVLETEQQPVMTEEQPATTEFTSGEQDRRSIDRPQSSVYHDYTTTTSSAVGDIKIHEVNQEGRFVRLINEGRQELEFGGYMIQQNVGGHPVAVFRFPPRTKFTENSTITVWSGSTEQIEHQPPKNFVWKEQHKWGTGPECTTILCKPNGQAIAWMTAAHRFTKNPYDETQDRCPSEEEFIPDTGVPTNTQDEPLTEVNVNLNEPKPEPVYLRREKQAPPSLIAQKHPHGTSTGTVTHPQSCQPRPFTYGNDNSSVNRQSRIQTTRPDPIPGQPYAGGSANRIGSAPLKKFTGKGTGTTIRGSGGIANRSNPGVTSPPPTAFQTPHSRFETGMEQIQSQHHVDFLPPMPRPPLFSTW